MSGPDLEAGSAAARMTEIDPVQLEADSVDVAPSLLGLVLMHATPTARVAVRLTEVEAYQGSRDPGSHAYRGRTQRNAVMFGPAGHLYVYFTYGMHWCANIVCGATGEPQAVLLRAGEVLEGYEIAWRRRYPEVPVDPDDRVRSRDLARGPARLARCLGLDATANGAALNRGGPLQLLEPERADPRPSRTVLRGPRVGVSGPGGDGQRYPWRFWLDGERSVSAYRAAVVRSRPRSGS